MTRKDYVAIAESISTFRRDWANDEAYLVASEMIADRLANVFAKDNERFDFDKFMEACI